MRTTLVFALLVLFPSVFASLAIAQLPTTWRAHDWERPVPRVVDPGAGGLPVPPPSDAIVLFDGSDLDAWRGADGGEPTWKLTDDGVLESVANAGYLYTRQAFGDCQLHIEWASPTVPEGKSQGRGNSGVFLMGKYEVQVLDTYKNRTYADGGAGAIYGQYPPLVNASRPPGEWQSYDIIFRRPRFGADGKLLEKASLTVLHNGVLVQDHTRPFGPTTWLYYSEYEAHPDRLPLGLQDHGNPVRFRNIWIRPLNENPRPTRAEPYETVAIDLTDEEMDRLVGQYGGYNVIKENGKLYFTLFDRKLEMVAITPTEFHTRFTYGTIKFETDDDGNVSNLNWDMGDGGRVGERED